MVIGDLCQSLTSGCCFCQHCLFKIVYTDNVCLDKAFYGLAKTDPLEIHF